LNKKKISHIKSLDPHTNVRVYNDRTIQLYLDLGLTTEQIAGFLQCVLKNKEAFCREVLPIYREKLEEIDKQIYMLQRIKSNLEERIRSILDEQHIEDQEE